ncbi:Cacna1h, partial [Symbiodinium necroappetens]
MAAALAALVVSLVAAGPRREVEQCDNDVQDLIQTKAVRDQQMFASHVAGTSNPSTDLQT